MFLDTLWQSLWLMSLHKSPCVFLKPILFGENKTCGSTHLPLVPCPHFVHLPGLAKAAPWQGQAAAQLLHAPSKKCGFNGIFMAVLWWIWRFPWGLALNYPFLVGFCWLLGYPHDIGNFHITIVIVNGCIDWIISGVNPPVDRVMIISLYIAMEAMALVSMYYQNGHVFP